MKIPLDLGTVTVRRNEKSTAIIFHACQGNKEVIVTIRLDTVEMRRPGEYPKLEKTKDGVILWASPDRDYHMGNDLAEFVLMLGHLAHKIKIDGIAIDKDYLKDAIGAAIVFFDLRGRKPATQEEGAAR